ncbi:unnamed protein product, partial [marine sediment metagenome]
FNADDDTVGDSSPDEQWYSWHDEGASTDIVLTQDTVSSMGTFKTNIQNGRPVVRFDGTDDFLLGQSMGLSSFTVIVVALNPVDETKAVLIGEINEATPKRKWELFKRNAGEMAIFIAEDADGDPNLLNRSSSVDLESIIEATYQDGESVIGFIENGVVIDNDLSSEPPATSMATSSTVLSMASLEEGGQYMTVDIGEALIFNRKLTDAELSQIRAWLNARWAVF